MTLSDICNLRLRSGQSMWHQKKAEESELNLREMEQVFKDGDDEGSQFRKYI